MTSLQFLRINEEENSTDFLEWTAYFFGLDHPYMWKWVVLSLHGALYGFAVCAIQGTDPDRVMKERRLIDLRDALKRCSDPAYMLQFVDSKVLSLTPEQKWTTEKLRKDSRNNFEHFTPKQWSIEVSGFPNIVRHAGEIIKFLAFESGNVRLDESQRSRVYVALAKLGVTWPDSLESVGGPWEVRRLRARPRLAG